MVHGNRDLAHRTEQESATVRKLAGTTGELAATAKRNANSAAEANKLAQSSAEATQTSKQELQRLVAVMDTIAGRRKEINDILGLIDSIAFQTNILALNAAVEAARAGEQGRGFSVVAAEVRTLAQRAAEAAKDIRNLVKSSSDESESGARIAHDVRVRMEEAVVSVQRVTQIIENISSAASAESDAIGGLSNGVSQLDGSTQHTSGLVEQLARAVQTVSEQINGLSASLHRGAAHAAASTPTVESPVLASMRSLAAPA